MDVKVLKSEFSYSVPEEKLMRDLGMEICFVGRSNVGKSSLLNALCQKKTLARTSKLPGRTRHAVFYEAVFAFDDEKRCAMFTDLPGFGYAAMSKTEAADCEKLIFSYIKNRQNLKLLLLLLDMRRSPDEREKQIVAMAQARCLDIMIVLTKADKIVISKRKNIAQKIADEFNIDAAMLVIHSTHNHESTLSLRSKLFDEMTLC